MNPEPSTQGGRIWREQTPENGAAISDFHDRMRKILDSRTQLKEKQDNELDPRILPLSCEARRQWIEYDSHLEKERGEGGYFSRIAGLANKLPEHAARLAGILALYDDLNCLEISEGYMKAGILLAQYFSQEALRLKDMRASDKDLNLAQRLLDWIKEKQYREIPLQDIYQLAPITEIRNAARARKVMAILTEHGHVFKIEKGKDINGVHRKEVWGIIP